MPRVEETRALVRAKKKPRSFLLGSEINPRRRPRGRALRAGSVGGRSRPSEGMNPLELPSSRTPPRRRTHRKKKPRSFLLGSEINPRRRPTLPHSYPCSTIGAEGLNCRVRNGNGCFPLAMATRKLRFKDREYQRIDNRVTGSRKHQDLMAS